MRKILFFFFAIHFSISWAAYSKIVATGTGPTQREALIMAQRDAVEQGVGVLIDSQSLSENSTIIEDNIYSKARGFIKNYTVISRKKNTGGDWEVTIECEVSQEKIKDNLEALGILRDRMGNPRIKVLYDEKIADGSIPNQGSINEEAYEGIVEYLTEMEFPVVESKSIEPEANKQAEYLLLYSIKSIEQEPIDTFKKAWVMISTKIINTSSNQVMATQVKKVLGVDKDSLDFAYRKAARKAGKLAAQFLVDKWVQLSQGKTVSGREVFLELVNIKDYSLLKDFKTNLEKNYGVKKIIQRSSTSGTTEYEITYIGDIDTLQESVCNALKKMGFKPKNPVSFGDRIRIEVSPSTY